MKGSTLVVAGPPGAGKSTVAGILADRFERSVLITGDSFFAFLARGSIAPWLPESGARNEVVIQAAAAAAGRYAAGGYVTVYDGVVGPWFIDMFAAATGLESVNYLVLLPSVERCVQRVKSRQGHGFTDLIATRAMHREFASAQVDHRHVLTEPPDEANDVADLALAAISHGALAYPA